MKRKKIASIVAIAIVTMCTVANGQEIDTDRMDRDLEVSKNILQTLLGEGNEGLLWGNRMEADYLEGYGVIFTIPQNMRYAYTVTRAKAREDREVKGTRSHKGKSDAPVVVGSGKNTIYVGEFDSDSLQTEENEKKKEHITTFFADYAVLINQLKPGERIKIQNKDSFNESFYFAFSGYDEAVEERGRGFSAEVAMKDITAYKSGKLTRQEFANKIVFEEAKKREKIQDLELFGSILKRLYSPDLSETFFTENTPRYERMENYGVIFYMKTFSSYANDNVYNMPVLSRADVTQEEREKTIIELYPKFEQSLKRDMLDYGRTITSLDDDEVLSIDVELTRCKDCDIPKSVIVTVPVTVLKKLNQGTITTEKALNEVKIKKNMN